jgi:hypothetical protein
MKQNLINKPSANENEQLHRQHALDMTECICLLIDKASELNTRSLNTTALHQTLTPRIESVQRYSSDMESKIKAQIDKISSLHTTVASAHEGAMTSLAIESQNKSRSYKR